MESLVYQKKQFINADLKKSTEKIRRCGDNIRKNYIKVASELATIDESESYLDDGFENAIDYAGQIFGMKKTTAYVMINIGKEWISEDGERTVLTETGADYSVSQIGALMPVGVEIATTLHKEGDISPDMSVRAIKAVVKAVQQGIEEDTAPEETGDPEPNEEEPETAEIIGDITIFDDGGIITKGDFPEWFMIELDGLIKNLMEKKG